MISGVVGDLFTDLPTKEHRLLLLLYGCNNWYIMLMSMIVVTDHIAITCYYDFIMLWMMQLVMIFRSIHHQLNGVNLVSYRRSNLAMVVYIGSKFESTPVISMYLMLMLG
jgi:hypothetical protein